MYIGAARNVPGCGITSNSFRTCLLVSYIFGNASTQPERTSRRPSAVLMCTRGMMPACACWERTTAWCYVAYMCTRACATNQPPGAARVELNSEGSPRQSDQIASMPAPHAHAVVAATPLSPVPAGKVQLGDNSGPIARCWHPTAATHWMHACPACHRPRVGPQLVSTDQLGSVQRQAWPAAR